MAAPGKVLWQQMPLARAGSFGLSLAGGALLVVRPDVLADAAIWSQRLALALLLVGMVGSLSHGLALQPGRQPLARMSDPRLAWPLLLLGIAGLVLL